MKNRWYSKKFLGMSISLALLFVVVNPANAVSSGADTPSMALAQISTGSISGTVYEQGSTTPIEYITVEVIGASGYFGICTDSSGHFELTGLPLDVPLQIMASPWTNCKQGGSYVIEYWPEAVNLNSAGSVTLTAENPDRTDINFTLDPGGAISGTIYASDGVTPLPHIAISFTDDNHVYGDMFCSDDNGQYSFHSVPFNVPVRLRADAYRDSWCDSGADYLSEYWGETLNDGPMLLTVTEASPVRTGVNFAIDPAGSEPVPYLAAWTQSGIIEAFDWPDGARVKLKIEDPTTPLSPDYSAEADAPYAVFNLADQFEIKPGMIVTASGAYTTKFIIVKNLEITNVDADSNTVTGIATPDNWMWMWFNDDEACCRDAESDEDGNWMIDIGAPGPNGEPEADLANGSSGAVHLPSGDGRTSAAWAFPDPNIDVWYLDGMIEAFGWPTGTPLTLKIEDTSTPLSPDYSAETNVTEMVPWEPTIPYATFNVDESFEMEPGMIVTISGEYMTRDVVIHNLRITNIDQEHDMISGAAAPDNWLWMYFDASCDPVCRSTESDENGSWTIDYRVPGAEGQPVADIGPESSGAIHIPSGDGKTSVMWFISPNVTSITRLNANPTSASSVNLLVAFSENVSDVDIHDFTLDIDGEISGASIVSVTGSGSTRTVKVNTGSRNGTLGLDIAADATITDLDGNTLEHQSFVPHEEYMIEKIPILLTPGGEPLLHRRPTFDWTDIPGVTSYQIVASTSRTFGTVLWKVNTTTSIYTPPADLPAGKVIYWRVRAKVSGVWSPWSETWSFTTPKSPSVPVLVSPLNKAITRNYTPLLNWNNSTIPSGGAAFDHYRVQVSTDNTFPEPPLVDAVTPTGNRSASFYTPGAALLVPNQQYYWRVRAYNVAGEYSSWSTVRTFFTALLPPDNLTPTGGEIMPTRKPVLDWTAVEGASGYTVQVSTSSTFGTLLVNTKVTVDTFTPSTNLPAKRMLYWRVRANGTNGPSSWTSASFRTP